MAERPRPAWSRGLSVEAPNPLLAGQGLENVTPEWAWGGSAGEGVRVAVVDSGVEAGHPALADCVVEDGVAIALGEDGHPVETPGPHEDLFGHGTACAEIIHRLAPAARITSVRVLNQRLGGKSIVFLRGLAWAIDQRFDVINLSLGTGKRDWALPFYELCDEAYYRGSMLVTAANNISRPSFPSLYGSVTSVACNTSDDPHEYHVNPDPPTEFLARGIDVDVAWRAGSRMTVTGNSFAAPHIAGHLALIRAKHPALRPFQAKTVLAACAANVQRAAGVAPDAEPQPRSSARRTALHSLDSLLERYPELAPQPAAPKPEGSGG